MKIDIYFNKMVTFCPSLHKDMHSVLIKLDTGWDQKSVMTSLNAKVGLAYHILRESPFSYVLEEADRKGHFAVQFPDEQNAIEFAAATGGKLILADHGQARAEEAIILLAIDKLKKMSRSKRKKEFPEFDNKLLSWARKLT